MYENFIFVSNNLTEREKLEQLAEEATELAQAAPKAIRAKKLSNNSTPTTEETADMNLAEEVDDVLMCICLYYGGVDKALDKGKLTEREVEEFTKISITYAVMVKPKEAIAEVQEVKIAASNKPKRTLGGIKK